MSAAYFTGTAANTDGLFGTVRAALTANGWTEFDTPSDTVGNRDVIFKSTAGDADANNFCYLRLTAVSNVWSMRCYTDFDTTTSLGAREAAFLAQTALSSTSFTYFFRVNEFALGIVLKIGATYYKGYAGFVRRGMPQSKNGLTRTTAGYAAGVSTMTVFSNMTTRLKVGQRVVIYNRGESSASANFNNSEFVTILSIAAGSITFSAPTAFAYDTGAVIGWNPHPVVVLPFVTGEVIASTFYTTLYHDGTYVSNTSQTGSTDAVILAAESSADPDDVSLEYQGGVISATLTVASKTGFHGYLYHYEAAASGAQAKEDTMNDGDNTFIVVVVLTTAVMLLGPI